MSHFLFYHYKRNTMQLLYNTVGNSLRLTSKNSMAVILGLAWVTSITTVFNCALIYFLKIEHDNQNWIQGYMAG